MLGIGNSIVSAGIVSESEIPFSNSYSLDFNGTDEYGSVSSLPVALSVNNATLSCWAKFDTSGTNSVIWTFAVDTSNVFSIFHKQSNNTINFMYRGGGTDVIVSSSTKSDEGIKPDSDGV